MFANTGDSVGDACAGDSGGPFVMKAYKSNHSIIPDDCYYLMGIVSFGASYCGSSKPGNGGSSFSPICSRALIKIMHWYN